MQILVADDSNFMRGQIIRTLRVLFPDATIDDVGDGEAALQHFRSGSYDLILLDYLMPKIDGGEVLKQIRQVDKVTKIAMLSADVQRMTKEEMLLSGADLFINKPLSGEKAQELAALVSASVASRAEE